MKNVNIYDRLSSILDPELCSMFCRAAEKNGSSPEDVLMDFMRDYIVSDGHPGRVYGGRPWNR